MFVTDSAATPDSRAKAALVHTSRRWGILAVWNGAKWHASGLLYKNHLRLLIHDHLWRGHHNHLWRRHLHLLGWRHFRLNRRLLRLSIWDWLLFLYRWLNYGLCFDWWSDFYLDRWSWSNHWINFAGLRFVYLQSHCYGGHRLSFLQIKCAVLAVPTHIVFKSLKNTNTLLSKPVSFFRILS